MTPRLDALIFDVDGTLAETEEAHRAAFNQAFDEWRLGWRWDKPLYARLLDITGGKERLRHFVRAHGPAHADRFADDAQIIALHIRKTAIYMDMVSGGQVALRPGVERLLDEARSAGLKLAIATTTNLKPLRALFDGTLGREAMDRFAAIAAGDMAREKKPAPELFNIALKQLGLNPANCLAIEDSFNGLTAARAAGMKTLITVNDYTRDQDFTGASAIVSDLGEPETPAHWLAGDPGKAAIVDVAALRAIHARPIWQGRTS
jgi:HAD superfamily hydrolase (TIGR01509 family)